MITQSDLIYLMLILSYYLNNSDKEHLTLLKTVFRYISKTLDVELIFTNNAADNLIRYINANFVEAIDSCKSTDDYMFMLVREYILYQIKHQIVITLSSCELEYMTMFKVDKEIM